MNAAETPGYHEQVADVPSVTKARIGRDGSQTLARGLTAFNAVAESRDGLSVAEIADQLDVHRSIAYRVLQTFVDFGYLTKSPDGVYRIGARIATLSDAYLVSLRGAASPVMGRLAEELGSTVSLFIREGEEAVAISLVEPLTASHHLAFRAGMRTPINRGAAAYALLSADPHTEGEPAGVEDARRLGYARSSGEVEVGAHAIAAWIPLRSGPRACLNLITFRPDIAERASLRLREAAGEIAAMLE